jgi:alpha-D-ribose 1-methylphosphonate 5-phosphate C-P lyase
MTHAAMPAQGYNFAYLDEGAKRMIRRGLLKAVAIPGPSAPARCRWPTDGARAASR